MKKIILFILLIAGRRLSADETQETFLKAGAHYEQGQMHHALTLYEKITVPYPAVFYNKGLCQYALGHYSRALVDFRRAQRGGNKDLLAKASQAVILTQKKIGLAPDSLSFRTHLAAHTIFSGDFVRLLFLLLLAVFAFVIAFRCYTSMRLVLLMSFLVGVGSFCAYEYWFSKQRYGVVITKEAILYAGPDKEFHKIGKVVSGEQVKVVQQDQSWYKVYFRAQMGWVEQGDLELF